MKLVNEKLGDFLKPKSEDEIKKGLLNDEFPDRILISSANAGYLEGVKIALERGADIDAFNGDALLSAVQKMHFEIVKYLLKNGATKMQQYILAWAAYSGNIEIVKLLAEHGAKSNKTAIDAAIAKQHEGIVNHGKPWEKGDKALYKEIAEYLTYMWEHRINEQ